MLSCQFLSSLSQVAADRSPRPSEPLPDVFHRLFPYIKTWQLCNWLLYFFCFVTALRFGLQPSVRWIALRRFLFLMGTLFFIRSFSIYITALSVPQPNCKSDVTPDDSAWKEAFLISIAYHATCGDIMPVSESARYAANPRQLLCLESVLHL